MSNNNAVRPSILQNLDAGVATLIAEKYGFDPLDALLRFLDSETHRMLEDDSLKMWHFSAAALFDMWEVEAVTGSPLNSAYLRGE